MNLPTRLGRLLSKTALATALLVSALGSAVTFSACSSGVSNGEGEGEASTTDGTPVPVFSESATRYSILTRYGMPSSGEGCHINGSFVFQPGTKVLSWEGCFAKPGDGDAGAYPRGAAEGQRPLTDAEIATLRAKLEGLVLTVQTGVSGGDCIDDRTLTIDRESAGGRAVTFITCLNYATGTGPDVDLFKTLMTLAVTPP